MINSTRAPPRCAIFRCPACTVEAYLEFHEGLATPWRVTCHCCGASLLVGLVDAKLFDSHGRAVLPAGSPLVTTTAAGNGAASQQADNAARNNASSPVPRGKDYYAVLGVERTATAEQIKRAYYQLAMRHHPDKYTGTDPAGNEEHFKAISQAYQVLHDPSLRDRYDRYGTAGDDAMQPEDGFVDPEALFQQLFGGEVFVDLIGELSLSRDLGDAMKTSTAAPADGTSTTTAATSTELSAEQKAARERQLLERVYKLARNLESKMDFYVRHPAVMAPNADGDARAAVLREFEARVAREAEDLKHASYGVELLHALGYMYIVKAKQWLGKEETPFGIGKFWHNVREKGHVVSETIGTIRSAVQLQQAFTKLEASRQAGEPNADAPPAGSKTAPAAVPLTAEEQAFWEKRMTERGMDMVWKGSKMEIESVIRNVCDLLLSGQPLDMPPSGRLSPQLDPSVPAVVDKAVLKRRADALLAIGRIYENVKPTA